MREKRHNINFDPADYAYLDNKDFTLAGWMWEFIRRSPDYNQRYNDIKRNSETAYLSTRSGRKIAYKYEWTISSDKNNLRNKLVALEKEVFLRPSVFYSKGKDSKHYFLLELTDYPGTYVGIPKPTVRYCDFVENKPFILGATTVLLYRFKPDTVETYTQEEYDNRLAVILKDRLTNVSLLNTLYLGVSLEANLNDAKKEVNTILEQNIEPKRRKARPKKWNFYLMTYDLFQIDNDYENIADELAKNYSDKKALLDANNIRNYHKNALALINGSYKKYLNIAK